MKLAPLLTTLALLAGIVFLLWKKPTEATTPVAKDIPEVEKTPEAEVAEEVNRYTEGLKTRDGTGKYYMGREIAQVMGHPAINWLERGNREDEEAPSKAIQLLKLKPDAVIADIGAGSGYYTFRLAAQHPTGQLIAVDIQEEMISHLEHEKEIQNATNVSAHLGKIDDTLLKANSIDAAIMVDAYHEFSHPYEMMQSIARALRPGGRLFLLEYRAEDPTVPIKPLHKMSEQQAIKEMAAVGLEWAGTKHDLPWQHLLIFEKK
ncbi:class I SAM-dependent methyltransferase [Akkermansiaceae bacterium]|nr:class I SAM-dependent methyltransferase [Akkermansiaceae bacterium]